MNQNQADEMIQLLEKIKLELYLLNERVTLIDAHSREVDMNTNEIRSMLREILSVISSD